MPDNKKSNVRNTKSVGKSIPTLKNPQDKIKTNINSGVQQVPDISLPNFDYKPFLNKLGEELSEEAASNAIDKVANIGKTALKGGLKTIGQTVVALLDSDNLYSNNRDPKEFIKTTLKNEGYNEADLDSLANEIVSKGKYAFGGTAMYIESPEEAVERGNINQVKAQLKAYDESKGLQQLGDFLNAAGNSLATYGKGTNLWGDDEKPKPDTQVDYISNYKGLDGQIKGIYNTDLRQVGPGESTIDWGRFKPKYAFGGDVPIEAEGEEIIQEPNGNMYELEGASHENGGIDLNVPQGSQIYSKRLKGVDGKTMADRKAYREKQLAKLEKLVSLNPNDKILKKTLEKTKTDFAKQEADDMAQMNYMQENSDKQEFGNGGTAKRILPEDDLIFNNIRNYNSPTTRPFSNIETLEIQPINKTTLPGITTTTIPTYAKNYTNSKPFEYNENKSIVDKEDSKSKSLSNLFSDINSPATLGDVISLYGKYKAATDPERMTLLNRANDTPNQNFFRNYGKNGLDKIQEEKNLSDFMLNETLKHNTKSAESQMIRNSENSRGINTLRAFNLATDINKANADNQAWIQNQQVKSNILQREGQLLNQIDQMVMQGEATRDDADRRDRDNFNMQLQRDINTKNQGIQEIGKTINDIAERESNLQAINNMYPDFNIGKDGKIRAKGNPEELTEEVKYWNGKPVAEYQKFLKKKEEGYFFDNETQAIYNKDGKEVDKSYNVIPNGKTIDMSSKKREEENQLKEQVSKLRGEFPKFFEGMTDKEAKENFVKWINNPYLNPEFTKTLKEKDKEDSSWMNETDDEGNRFESKRMRDLWKEANPGKQPRKYIPEEKYKPFNPVLNGNNKFSGFKVYGIDDYTFEVGKGKDKQEISISKPQIDKFIESRLSNYRGEGQLDPFNFKDKYTLDFWSKSLDIKKGNEESDNDFLKRILIEIKNRKQ
nr:MAG TPA: hypothetical protein [Caudoviricetes sp.]